MRYSVETERLNLVPLGPEHRAEYVRVYAVSREHFQRWFPAADSHRSLEEAFDEELSRSRQESDAGTGLRLAGVLRDGRIAGFLALTQIFRRSFQNAYASWSVSADQLRTGVATEGVLGLLDIAFAPEPAGLGLHRVQANIIPANIASIRVAEKTGFRHEGTALRYLHINGQWQDHGMFAKTVEEHTLLYLR